MTEVVEVRNTRALLTKELQAILEEALSSKGGDPATHAQDIINVVNSPDDGLIVVAEGANLKGVAIILAPRTSLIPYPMIVMFYCSGEASTRNALRDKVVDFVGAKGYTRVWATNGTGRSDAVWAKLFNAPGWKVNPVASVLEFSKG